ncbi:hypothetical protein LJC58_00815 [Lachnospiraceae bacterium OttesenSCG-928-D06]|nr:hypothetical protein [Lachnospiraceae bacterium OttesenSCG-928-D06]
MKNSTKVAEKFGTNVSKCDMIFMGIHIPEVDGYEAKLLIIEQKRKEPAKYLIQRIYGVGKDAREEERH